MKNIIFDIGNVLLRFQPHDYLSQFYNPDTVQQLMTIIFASPEWIELDKGTMMIEDVIGILTNRYPQHNDEIVFVLNHWTDMMTPIEKNVKLAYQLIEKKAKSGDKESKAEMDVLAPIKEVLEAGKPVRTIDFSKEEIDIVKQYTLLTMKPLIYVANLGEEDLENPESNPYYVQLKNYAEKEGCDVVPICAKIESELVGLDKEEKDMFLTDLGIDESGLDKLIKEAYALLGLHTFFTVGADEVRAWTFKKGMLAPEMAGIIHTDFQKGFIKAETYSYDDLMEFGSEHALRDAGKIRQEGKQYVGQDGDIMFFKFNV